MWNFPNWKFGRGSCECWMCLEGDRIICNCPRTIFTSRIRYFNRVCIPMMDRNWNAYFTLRRLPAMLHEIVWPTSEWRPYMIYFRFPRAWIAICRGTLCEMAGFAFRNLYFLSRGWLPLSTTRIMSLAYDKLGNATRIDVSMRTVK